jgi:hypothetical protein
MSDCKLFRFVRLPSEEYKLNPNLVLYQFLYDITNYPSQLYPCYMSSLLPPTDGSARFPKNRPLVDITTIHY